MTTMTTYTVVLNQGTVDIEADAYRTPSPNGDEWRELYFYMGDGDEDAGNPVATFPAGQWDAVFEEDRGQYWPD